MERDGQSILSFLEANVQKQLDFVIEMCNQNSYTYNKNGVDRVGDIINGALESLFASHEVIKQTDVGNFHVFRNPTSSRVVYLIGHMDTVFPPDHPFQECRVEGDRLNGPGTGDMKGGIAVVIFALKALGEAGLMPDLNLSLIFNSDEEIGSPYSRSLFTEEKEKAAACLVAECAGLNGEVVISRNGKMGIQVDCYGQDRHVGFGSHEKASAIMELAHKVINLEALNASLPGVSLNAGKIEGGLGPCTVAGHARCLFDIRWEKEEHKRALIERIEEEIVRPSRPGCRSEWKGLNWRPAMPLQKGTEGLFKRIQEVGAALGQRITAEHRRGTSDANFFGSSGIPTLDGLGPICDKDHTPQETITISSLKERSALLALFLASHARKTDLIL
jgi:glutamate carboxypeptidase